MPKFISITGLAFSLLFFFSLRDNVVGKYEIHGTILCQEKSCKQSLPVKMVYKVYNTGEVTFKTVSSDYETGSFRFTYSGRRNDLVTIVANYNDPKQSLKGCNELTKIISISPEVAFDWFLFKTYKNKVEIAKNTFNLECTPKP